MALPQICKLVCQMETFQNTYHIFPPRYRCLIVRMRITDEAHRQSQHGNTFATGMQTASVAELSDMYFAMSLKLH